MGAERLCDRCHAVRDSWFIDGGYVCNGCMAEWEWWRFVARLLVTPADACNRPPLGWHLHTLVAS